MVPSHQKLCAPRVISRVLRSERMPALSTASFSKRGESEECAETDSAEWVSEASTEADMKTKGKRRLGRGKSEKCITNEHGATKTSASEGATLTRPSAHLRGQPFARGDEPPRWWPSVIACFDWYGDCAEAASVRSENSRSA
eukprot:6177054-Pleurochrysis_carterae.AAC.4